MEFYCVWCYTKSQITNMIKCSSCQQDTDVDSNCDKTKPNHTAMRWTLETGCLLSAAFTSSYAVWSFWWSSHVDNFLKKLMALEDKNCTHVNSSKKKTEKGHKFGTQDLSYYWSQSKS